MTTRPVSGSSACYGYEVLPETRTGDTRVVLGRVGRPFGIRGTIRLHSYTQLQEDIFHYSPWSLRQQGIWREYRILFKQRHGKGWVARLAGVGDRDQAAALQHCDIALPRSRLPPLPAGQYYWHDLSGLVVRNREAQVLGRVRQVLQTPTHALLAVTGNKHYLIPFVLGVHVLEVQMAQDCLFVDWPVSAVR